MPTRKEILEIGGREVSVSNPDKVYFPKAGHTKMDLVNYYLAVADGALRGVAGRLRATPRVRDRGRQTPPAAAPPAPPARAEELGGTT